MMCEVLGTSHLHETHLDAANETDFYRDWGRELLALNIIGLFHQMNYELRKIFSGENIMLWAADALVKTVKSVAGTTTKN